LPKFSRGARPSPNFFVSPHVRIQNAIVLRPHRSTSYTKCYTRQYTFLSPVQRFSGAYSALSRSHIRSEVRFWPQHGILKVQYCAITLRPCLSPSPWKPYKPYNYSHHDPIIDTPGHCTAQISPRNCQRAPTDHVGTIATSALDIFPRRRMSACIHRDNAQSCLAKTTAGQAKILRTEHEPPRILQPFPRRHTSPQPGHNALYQRRYHGARGYHVDVRHRELERGTNESTRSLEL
jgi:hypothetical protein